jgi:hypothetical protein
VQPLTIETTIRVSTSTLSSVKSLPKTFAV